MTAINFPDSPSLNDEFTASGRTWVYAGDAIWNVKTITTPSELDDLTDVTAPTPSPDDVLTWNGTAWVNAAPAVSLPSQTGNAGELLVTNGTDASWSNTVSANVSSAPALVVAGQVSQTNNVQEWYRGATRVAAIGASGQIYGSGVSANSVQLAIKGATSQTANIAEIQNSSGTALASFGPSGLLTATPASPHETLAASSVGYVGMPQVSTSTSLNITNGHAGKHIYTTVTGQTHTIPANSGLAFEIGTTIVFVNPASVTTTIAITTDTLILAGTGATGSRTLAPYGMATALKITDTSWMISGNGLS